MSVVTKKIKLHTKGDTDIIDITAETITICACSSNKTNVYDQFVFGYRYGAAIVYVVNKIIGQI